MNNKLIKTFEETQAEYRAKNGITDSSVIERYAEIIKMYEGKHAILTNEYWKNIKEVEKKIDFFQRQMDDFSKVEQ